MIEDIQFWLAKFVAELLMFVVVLVPFFGLLIGLSLLARAKERFNARLGKGRRRT